jgi:hypothetical protein
MVWEEPLMTASKGQQQNKITLKTAIIQPWTSTYYLKTSPIQHYYSFIRYHRCSSKSDLEIPENSSKFISHLLFSRSASREDKNCRIVILHLISFGPLHWRFNSNHNPILVFFILKKHFIDNSCHCSSHAVSAVTFVTAITFLEMQNYTFSGHMVLYG